MRTVTVYRHNDGSARFSEWADRDRPTALELTPVGAEIISYTKLCHDTVDYLRTATKDEVTNILSSYLP